MQKSSGGEITAGRDDLFSKFQYLLLFTVEEMISDIFLEVLLTVLEE